MESLSPAFLCYGGRELFHLPNIISHQKLLVIIVFLFAFYLFDLCLYRIIIGRSVYIADDTKCDGEVRAFHQGKF